VAGPTQFPFRGDCSRFHPDALTDYLAAAHNPNVIQAMCQD
jgi:haloacetate dehalogenase